MTSILSSRRAWLLAAVAVVATGRPARAVNVWLTTGTKTQLLAQKTDVLFASGAGSGGVAINVSASSTFQTISGFGAALTDSSAWLMQNKLTVAQRDKLMRQMFSPEGGIGLNYLRIPMGASDFTAGAWYTYNDNPAGGTDELQEQFSVAHDEAYIIPQLQQARALNADLKLMASPWSAPAWMKNSKTLTGSSLATQWEASYARYLTKFVQAYEAAGLPIDAITLQNEPLHTSNYPTMSMSATQQTRLIRDHLGPLFTAESIGAKILAYDHNWDNTAYPLQVLNDPAARQYVAGTAFHAYAGDVSAQTTVHNAYPDKDIYFTEITGGDWATNFADNLVWNFQNIIIGGTRNWAKTALLWNLALDENGNPHQGGCDGCRGVVTINGASGAITFNEEFYALGQAMKAIQPGAVRIASSTNSSINTVAFLNPDGSRGLIALNPNAAATTMRLLEGGQNLNYQIPGKSVATFLWDAGGADFDNGAFDDGGYQQGGGSLDAWTVFGNAIGNVSVAAEAVLDGEKSLKLFGQFTGSPNTSGVSQGITVAAGDAVRADLSALVRSADSIAGTANAAEMKIEFYSQYGAARDSANFVGELLATIADGASPTDAWLSRSLAGVAPTGTVEARLVLQFIQPSGQSGAVHIDGVTYRALSPGDYNGDGVVDGADLAVWLTDFGSADPSDADGNRDGVVDGADVIIWQQNLAASSSAATSALSAPECDGQVLAYATGVALIMAKRCPKHARSQCFCEGAS